MKKLLLILILLVSACSKQSTTYSNKLEEIISKGTLVIATSPDYAPLEFLDNNQNPVGSEMELAKYIADKLGVKLKIETMEFAGTLTAVDTEKVDLAISGFGWKEDRALNYELSIGYNNEEGSESSCHTILINNENISKYKTLTDFKGTTIAAQASSLQEQYASEQIEDVSIETVQTIDQALLALQSKKVDGVALSCELASGYANSIENIVTSNIKFDISADGMYSGNVVAAKKGETELIEKINEILNEVNSNGLYKKWNEDAKNLAKQLGINF